MNKFAAVITMDTDCNRFQAFAENNKHLEFEIFKGISGATMPRDRRIAAGFVTEEIADIPDLTDARLGIALSHWSLWQAAIKRDSAVLIMEDDVMTHPQIWSQIDSIPNLDEVDMVFFSANTDTTMVMTSPEGLTQAMVFNPKNPHPDWIRTTLARTNASDVRYWRLSRAFGLCCYLVTPRGAQALSKQMFPLRGDGVFVPFINHLVMQCAVDHRLNALYDELKVFIAMPFLAFTPHHNEFAPA
jgi:GR25 family glycosyltransferase involved in LPS biosynthesis